MKIVLETDIWGIISSCATAGTFIAAIFAIGYSYSAWKSSKKAYRYEVINETFREYRSQEMGLAMKAIWDFKRKCDKKGKTIEQAREILIDEYYRLYKKDGDKIINSIHNDRRRVSLYFQQIASLAARDKNIKKAILEIWSQRYLKVIPEILEPIEMIALPKCVGEETHNDRENYPQFMKDMLEMYETSEVKKKKTKIISRLALRAFGAKRKSVSGPETSS
jgi:hypothetical protein